MGNEQSAPSPRRQNRLSKPRTNTTAAASNPIRPNERSRGDSVSLQHEGSGLGNNRYSVVSQSTTNSPLDPAVYAHDRIDDAAAPEKKKRLSLFRSKTSQPKTTHFDIGNGVEIQRLNDTPVRKPVLRMPERWSRSNSLVDQGENSYVPPLPKNHNHRWSRTNSLVREEDNGGSSEKYASPPIPSRWSRSNSLVDKEEVKYEFTPPIPRAPVLRTPEQRAQVQSRPIPRNLRMSLQHVPYTQHQARLSLVPEGPSHQLSTKRSVVPETLQQLESPKFSPASRTNSDSQLSGLIRRRSLLQHGVATRNSWVDADSRKSLPSQVVNSPVDLPSYNYTPDKFTAPDIHLPGRDTRFADHFQHPRVATPDSMDYSHIGTFKLGSLRITNGCASPDLILERANTTSVADDYISAGHVREASRHGVGQRSQTISVIQETIKPPWITRLESPLQTVECAEPEPLTINTTSNAEYANFNFTESPTISTDLVREYQGLATSPFSFDRSPTSPKLEARSKHMAAEDELFDPEPGTPDITSIPTRKSIDSGFQPDETERPSYLGKGGKEFPMKPLAKADSGYSSNVSIRSFKNKAPVVPAKEGPPTPPKGPISRVASSTYSVASDSETVKPEIRISAKRSLPALPKEDMLQSFGVPPKVPSKRSFSNLKKEKFPLTTTTKTQTQLLSKSKKHGRSKSIPNILKPGLETQTSYSSSGSDVSYTSSSSRWRRNSKPKIVLPTQPVYTVQASPSHADQLSIPTPSAEASRHLEKRVDSFPVTSIPNSYPVIRRSYSKETLKTIFSVGSAEYREELTMKRLQSALPAVPTPIAEEPKPTFNRRHTYHPQAPAVAPISRKPVQRQTYVPQVTRAYQDTLEQKPRRDFETEITSFESVASSLGKSPYDAAMSSTDAKKHQQQRTRSMTAQLEADAATRFADSRTSPAPPQSLHRTASYGSMNYENQTSSPIRPSFTRVSSRPPSVHGNGNIQRFPQRSNPNLREPQAPVVEQRPPQLQHLQHSQRSMTNLGDETCGSVSSMGRIKSPPPVSMKTQGRNVPPKAKTTSNSSSPAPSNLPPQQPSQTSRPASQPIPVADDTWATQQSYWASRKREAIQTRKSLELQRPEQARLSFENAHGIQLRRPESARPSFDGQRRTGQFNSWDASGQKWGGQGNQNDEYDHTYGTYTYNEGGIQGGAYYDGEERLAQQIPQGVHGRSTSTSDMFALDGFGLDVEFGYDAPVAAGSRRKSGTANADFGVDMSDVPVLERVRVGS